ncbi:MAG: SRPBCC family protein [Hyphomicrobiales bacterium]
MASIHKEIEVTARPDQVWSAIRDIGGLHTRLVPGFVVDTKLEPGARIVTFGNGIVAREAIVGMDETALRLVWSASSGRLTHHNASVQVFPAGEDRSRIVWIADLLPDEMRAPIEGMIDQGMAVMKTTLDALGSASKAA